MMTEELELLVPEPIRKLKRVEFQKLGELGFFDDERVELLYGVVVEMTSIDPSHDDAVSRINELLLTKIGKRTTIRPQCSFAALDDSMPVPDFTLVERGRYNREHPARALLVIEIARTSLRRDRKLKMRLYAESEVDEYWIVNLVEDCLEVMRGAKAGVWTERTLLKRGDTVSPVAFPDVSFAVADLLD
ncbi:MAG TPA: Uma2 family endonuclease [Kofleriaceae bacterium]|nr:Uma2 family endonuclease [Kofleriaceae bacterium]